MIKVTEAIIGRLYLDHTVNKKRLSRDRLCSTFLYDYCKIKLVIRFLERRRS